MYGCNYIVIDYDLVIFIGLVGFMLIIFSEIIFLILYFLVIGIYYKNNLMKCNFLEFLRVGCGEEEEMNLGEVGIESVMSRFIDNSV